MAECHPVGFQWVMEAKERGAVIIHVDPRFTRTSALADIHVPLRPGSDIAFLGGVVNYILEHERWFKEYVVEYTNAATLINPEFRDTEDLDGVFSGFDAHKHSYDVASWSYEGMELMSAAEDREGAAQAEHNTGEQAGSGGIALKHGEPPQDRTLQDPRCVLQLLRKHYRRYSPEFVEETCGVPKDLFLRVAQALCDNSGRERTSAFAYAVGWTQHTVGVQYIRTAAIIQSLLGNIGRPGGGIMALRGHASIQGSTDIPTLYNLLPGYLPMPHTEHYRGYQQYIEMNAAKTGFWGNAEAYFVSLMKAYWGEAATRDNDWCFSHLPRISGDHSAYTFTRGMFDGTVNGFFVLGENPAVGSSNGRFNREALAKLDWMVVRDFVEIETASFWKNAPEIATGELQTDKIPTEVFFMPAAAHTEKNGSFTNTQRLLQWHHAAVEPKGDCRSELWFMYHLGRIIKEKLRDSAEPRDQPIKDLTWSYPTDGDIAEPSAEAVLAEISGWAPGREYLKGYDTLKPDGSTVCGCWIYCGSYADGINQTARRKPRQQQSYVGGEWGWAWPDNRHMLYNRASADPDGKPWSERKRYVWWDERKGQWTGEDRPDFIIGRAPYYKPPQDARAQDAIGGAEPFIMQADGKAWLFVPDGIRDGPLPTHYEPRETPLANALYPAHVSNPVLQVIEHALDPFNHPRDKPAHDGAFPFVATTYRLTEHHTAGGMSRFVEYLSELQPEFFCEVSPELAALRGLTHKGWATIVSARAAIEARVMVTDRMRPLRAGGRTIHTVGLPYHWGQNGLSTGDSANDLFHLALDPNVHIQESKAATCDIRPGRRPRGPGLLALLEEYRHRAGIEPAVPAEVEVET
ncbi:MAG: molybdopterin-dependent oxidoreductase [Candidatus Dormibacteraeota bacterium]|nr:molybdopterin-dependent oxidoreductase [Candidatus Dormibacteraeota bacterium]